MKPYDTSVVLAKEPSTIKLVPRFKKSYRKKTRAFEFLSVHTFAYEDAIYLYGYVCRLSYGEGPTLVIMECRQVPYLVPPLMKSIYYVIMKGLSFLI